MRIVEIAPLENGAHRNLTSDMLDTIPEGWAAVLPYVEIPESFPFVDLNVDGNTVTAMTAREVPQPEPESEEEGVDGLIDILLGVSGND